MQVVAKRTAHIEGSQAVGAAYKYCTVVGARHATAAVNACEWEVGSDFYVPEILVTRIENGEAPIGVDEQFVLVTLHLVAVVADDVAVGGRVATERVTSAVVAVESAAENGNVNLTVAVLGDVHV